MRIAGVASAFRGNYYRQEVIRDALKRDRAGKPEQPQPLDRLHAGKFECSGGDGPRILF